MFMQLENVLDAEEFPLFRGITLDTFKISLKLQELGSFSMQYETSILPGLYTGLISDGHLLLFV
jgi:hypothetical protein